ncbi:MAG TPA: hypothetical protein ENF52_07280 [Chloroflexi bacterium]|nr:hypothetical protein [Chloroflexota bacterium]
MELKMYGKIALRRWWLIAVPVIIVLVDIGVSYAPPAATYQIVMRFAAGTTPAGLSEDYDRYYPWLTSEYIANGLADVAETGAFAEAIAARLAILGHQISPAAIQPAIVTDNAQSILIVYLIWPDAEECVAIAEAITTEFTENGAAYFPQLRDVEPAVRRLDSPTPVVVPPRLRARLMGPAIKLGLALVVGLALTFLWHYLDPALYEAEELEALGINVLVQVPRHKKRRL